MVEACPLTFGSTTEDLEKKILTKIEEPLKLMAEGVKHLTA
jgi:hypothetical protein